MSDKAMIDISKISTISEFHRLMKDMLLFPDYYGANLDALHDVLTSRSKVDLTITNTLNTSEELQAYIPRVKKVLADVADENPGFTYAVFEGEPETEENDTSTHD